MRNWTPFLISVRRHHSAVVRSILTRLLRTLDNEVKILSFEAQGVPRNSRGVRGTCEGGQPKQNESAIVKTFKRQRGGLSPARHDVKESLQDRWRHLTASGRRVAAEEPLNDARDQWPVESTSR